jgi:hypothetical protein
MKTLIAIFLSLHFLTASAVYTSESSFSSLRLLETKQSNIFLVKAGKQWKGAEVEVIAENGETIMHQKLAKNRFSIDFREVVPGTYTIKFSKGAKAKEFKFSRH